MPEGHPWFDLLKHWYKNTRLTYRALDELFGGDELGLLTLAVNHERGASAPPVRADAHLEFAVAADRLHRGDNSLVVRLAADAAAGLDFEAAAAGPADGPRAVVRFAGDRPDATAAFELTASGEAVPGPDRWTLRPGGFLVFRLPVADPRPAVLSLRMPAGREFPLSKAHRDRREKLRREVRAVVKKRAKEFEARLRERPGRDVDAERELDDLQGYEELEELQVDLAIQEGLSLDDAIAATGVPDVVANRPSAWRSRVVELRPEPVPVVPLRPATPEPPLRPAPPRARRAPRPPASPRAASGGGWFGKLVAAGLLAAVPAAGLAVWKLPQLGGAKQWVQAKLNLPVDAGDVLGAMRASAREQNWTRIEAKELSREQMRAMQQGAANLGGGKVENTIPANVKVFFVGQRMEGGFAELEKEMGLPLCSNTMVVYQAADAAQAQEMWKTSRAGILAANDQPAMRQAGLQVRLDPVTIAHADEAVIQATNKNAVVNALARRGRYVALITVKIDGTATEADYRAAMTSLMAKLAAVP